MSRGESGRGPRLERSPPCSVKVMNEWSNTASLSVCRHGENRETFVSASKADVSVTFS